MSILTAQQRGDLAESMLSVAAHLAMLVHGDGGPEDVQEVLAGLDETQRAGLIVVLAGLVDPDQPISHALGWLEPQPDDDRPVRDLASDAEVELGADFVDMVAVQRYLAGAQVDLSDAEFIAAVEAGTGRGMSLQDIDGVRRVGRGVTANRVYRLRQVYLRRGWPLPPALQSNGRADLTDAQVVEIRELYAAGEATTLELSLRYGRTAGGIGRVVSGASYSHVGGPIRAPRGSKPKEASRAGFAGHTGPAPTARVAQAS